MDSELSSRDDPGVLQPFRRLLASPSVGPRLRFWWCAMSTGARWAWEVLDRGARAIAVFVLLAAIVGISYALPGHPVWIGAVILGVLLLGAFAEGAYRVWSDADMQGAVISDGLSLVDRLAVVLKKGEAIAARLDDMVSATVVLTLAADWHDKLYTLLVRERPDLARRFLDETDIIIPMPTINLTLINPAHTIMTNQVAWLKGIIGTLTQQEPHRAPDSTPQSTETESSGSHEV